jgi:hypothetical protein
MSLTAVCMKLYTLGKSTDKALGRCEVARSYLVGSWANSDEYDYSGYSGEMLMGHRNGASRDLDHFTKDGRANVAKYGDNDLTQKKTSIPLTDRILPQAKRVNLLTEQMRELEIEYKSGKMSITDYTLYRNILSVKRSRAEVLLKKAISVRPTPLEDDEYADEMPEDEVVYEVNSRATPTGYTSTWVDDLPNSNISDKESFTTHQKAYRILPQLQEVHQRNPTTLERN